MVEERGSSGGLQLQDPGCVQLYGESVSGGTVEGRGHLQCWLVVHTPFFFSIQQFTGLSPRHISGNHAQGVALSGSRLQIPCTIVMPKATPSIKVRNVSRLGAKVLLHGDDFDEAKAECARLAEAHGLIFVPPYDDPARHCGAGDRRARDPQANEGRRDY